MLWSRFHAVLGISGLLLCGCASEPDDASSEPAKRRGGRSEVATPEPEPGESAAAEGSVRIEGVATWRDGDSFEADIEIAEAAEVTIEPGARIELRQNARITLHGTLRADAADNRATLAGEWAGISVKQGGTLALIGVDLRGASEGLRIHAGALPAEFNDGTLYGGSFEVEAGASFSMDHVKLEQAGSSYVNGDFRGSFIDYDGFEIVLSDPAAALIVSDSKFSGSGGGDFFTANGGKLLRVEYSTVGRSHCPFHFNNLERFELDHVTTGGDEPESNDGFGVMFYMPEAGPHTIAYSNFNDPNWDQTERSAQIEIANTYIRSLDQAAGKVTFTPAAADGKNAHTSQNRDAYPRGTPGPR